MTIERSESIKELATALAKAQAALRPAVKDALNPHFKSKYADLGAVWEACREPLSTNGLSVVQLPADCEAGRLALTTMLLHSSGEYLSTTYSLKLQQDTAHGAGSALTYLRRYALAALVGVVADEDDDGNSASHQPQQQIRNAPQSPQRQPARTQQARLDSQVATYEPPPEQPASTNDKKAPTRDGMITRIRALWLDERQLGGKTPASELTADLREMPEADLIALGKQTAIRVEKLRAARKAEQDAGELFPEKLPDAAPNGTRGKVVVQDIPL
jgi:hypothetical protein